MSYSWRYTFLNVPWTLTVFVLQDEPGFGEFFGGDGGDPHRFGSGSSFFGSHYGSGREGGHHHQPQGHWGHQQRQQSQGHWGQQQHQQAGGSCRTVTQRVGNMVTTYTQCS